MGDVSWIEVQDVRRRAWRALVRSSAAVLRVMDDELQDEVDLTLQEYDALIHTVAAGEGGVRMTDLATAVLLSKPGLTSLVDRLERRGLMARVRDPEDRRAVRVRLTEDGDALFRRAAAFHVAQIEERFTDHLSEEEAVVVERVLDRVQAALPD